MLELVALKWMTSIKLSNNMIDIPFIHETGLRLNSYAERLDCPSTIYKPRLFVDGDQWCALYGENIQDGVAGFGDSPFMAYADFDKQWCKSLP